jgi:hypothetical protein
MASLNAASASASLALAWMFPVMNSMPGMSLAVADRQEAFYRGRELVVPAH